MRRAFTHPANPAARNYVPRRMGPLADLNKYYWKYKHLFIPGLLCAIASAGFSVAVPIVVRIAVDSIPRLVNLYHVYEGTPAQGYLYANFFVGLLAFGLIIIGLSLLSGTFSFLQRQTVVVASRHIEFDLRNALYDQLQRLSQGFYHTYSTGDMMARATSDIESVRRYIGPAIMYIVRAGVVIATAMTVMFIISPTLTLYALIPMPFLAVAVFFMASMQHRRSDALQAQYSRLTSRVQEALAGIRVLKAYTREDAEAETFDKESAAYRQRNLDLAVVDSGFRPVFLLLVGMAGIIVVWLGGRLVAEGSITIGNIAEYMIYVAYMTWPVASMGFVVTMIQRASASMIRLNHIFDTQPDIADTEEMVPSVREVRGAIRFDNVSFRYGKDGPWVLRDVSFHVPAGSTLAVVGRTGSGKTTLVEMIPRLLEATQGTVRIDDRRIRQIPLDVVRSSIGYVPQDVFLFSDTVGNNIAFGTPDADEERIEQAAREAVLLENVRDFPEGFETLVGERGITLSGGQKQRASIARALIRRPAILILDDALSAVDTSTENELLGHLRRYYGSCTVVIVSHRISSVMDADLILVLEDGIISERGSHEELLRREGLYADLYRKQLLEQEIAEL